MSPLFYILDGHTLVGTNDAVEWGRFFEQHSLRRVAQTEIGDVRISTVFVGLDSGTGDGPPLLFETMVFGGPLDQEQERCSTWEQAEAMHAAMVEKVRAAINGDTA